MAALTCVLASGCGYTFGTGLDERGIETIALTLVGNDTWRQRLEVELATRLARELPISTDLRLAPPDRADAVLEVVILEATERTLVPGNFTEPVREGALGAAVRLRLVRRDGQVLIDQVLLDRSEFRDPVGENLTTARAELTNDLARKIALALEIAQ